MKLYEYGPRAKGLRSSATSAIGLLSLGLLGLLLALTLASSAGAAPTAVPLGNADSFAILAGAGITNTGPTTVTGDIGTYPTPTITGVASMTVTGVNHADDGVTQSAKTDLVTAYDNAAAQGSTSAISADLGGQTLTAGVYNSASSIGLTGAVTLDAAGDPNAIFVFQAGSTLTTASASQVNLINGAQACNVFWQVGSSATLGTDSTFRGTVIALESITVTTGVTVDGRVLARNAAVTLDTDTITASACATATTTTAATTTAATTTTATTPKPTTPTPKPKPPVAPKPTPKPAPASGTGAASASSTPSPAVHPFGLTG